MNHQNNRRYLPNTLVEIVNSCRPCAPLRHVLFDFDGTVSLIREGWQQMMIELMLEFLLVTPAAEDEATLRQRMTDLVAHSTGRPTIDQMTYLTDEIVRRGGSAQDAQVYKALFLERLLARVNQRLAGLRRGRLAPAQLTVPGVIEFLAALQTRGVTCYLASGTEREAVVNEIDALGLAHCFEDRIYGPQDGVPAFSKKAVIGQILCDYSLRGCELVSIGDGKVEIEYTAEAGGIGVGVASNEVERQGINELKREQLIQAGANIIVPDFREGEALLSYLTGVG
ncbi:MAG: haloacid dehalogenase-like hydrolase [Anaerolineae bacterium]|nr:haloacid dehalogenase-like hydrolase [Anaerolineae bacterium]